MQPQIRVKKYGFFSVPIELNRIIRAYLEIKILQNDSYPSILIYGAKWLIFDIINI
ncbi:MAG TPA: hypothetical protein PLD95_05010 [bacterium]|jgi:hypothetical protein|nr:hypothetical protein [bacterium]